MAQWHDVQASFSGGEISTRYALTAGLQQANSYVGSMVNFMPTLQGTAVRAAGTRYAQTVETGLDARLIDFVTFDNREILLRITPGAAKGIENLEDQINPGGAGSAGGGFTQIEKQRVSNSNFVSGATDWEFTPNEYTATEGGSSFSLGCWLNKDTGRSIIMVPAVKPGETWIDTCQLWHTVGTDDIDPAIQTNNKVRITGRLSYNQIWPAGDPLEQVEIRLRVGTTVNATDVYDEPITPVVGSAVDINQSIDLPGGFVLGDKLFISIQVKALPTDDQDRSTVQVNVQNLGLFAEVLTNTKVSDITGTVPYQAEDLPDIQYIQSPYGRKELVLTHPKYPPQWIYFNGTTYIIEPIPFVDQDDNPNPIPWDAGNYPAACGSYLGRLILAGAEVEVPSVVLPYTTSTQETVWGSDVGQWFRFSVGPDDINPDDSIEFTTTFKSPVQWVYGQKGLLVGAESMEYVARADGIFSPGDLGVEMHSTHGSARVQPTGFGDGVLFAAEAGTKVRQMSASRDDEGWVAPDMTIMNPELCSAGIRRMVRMRNPQQMAVVLLKSGTVALLHQDKQTGVNAWSRLDVGGNVRDIAVTVDAEGFDILWLTVERSVSGSKQLHIEAIYKWTDTAVVWDYMSAIRTLGFSEPTSTLTNLDHLEGELVQVLGSGGNRTGYLGTFIVTGGQIVLQDAAGFDITVTAAMVGRSMPARIQTLPLGSQDPGATKRYSTIQTRVRASSLPAIGVFNRGEFFGTELIRPPARTPSSLMNVSEGLAILTDTKQANLGSDTYQVVVVQENLPIRCEVLGIYGKVTANSL